jgi:hypothetical protein
MDGQTDGFAQELEARWFRYSVLSARLQQHYTYVILFSIDGLWMDYAGPEYSSKASAVCCTVFR